MRADDHRLTVFPKLKSLEGVSGALLVLALPAAVMWSMSPVQVVIFIAVVVIAVALMLMLLAKRQGENVYPKMRYAGQDNTKIAAPLSATTQASEIQTSTSSRFMIGPAKVMLEFWKSPGWASCCAPRGA